MDHTDPLCGLRAGLPPARAEARARARWQLVAHAEEAAREQPVRLFAWTRRRLRLLAAAAFIGVLAVVVVALGVFDQGARVESAAAEALHQTATVAEAGNTPVITPPAPGQFLYTKTKEVELQGWLQHGHFGSKAEPRVFTPHAGNPYPQALVSTLVEKWIAPSGTLRQRETLARVKFFSAAAQRRWEAAGSPPPWSFDPRWHDATRHSSGQLVKEFTTSKWAADESFPDPAKLPTDPQALRHAVEAGQVKPLWVFGGTRVELLGDGKVVPVKSPNPEETIENLFEILEKPITTPALRAAAFNALAEIPGIRLVRHVTDAAGRRGEAITLLEQGDGLRTDFIFDPHTAELLAHGETVVGPKAIKRAVPVGTPFRQTAYLESGIVDSARETTAEAKGE